MKCALCQHFTAKGHPKHAAVGLGRCRAYTQMAVFVRWDGEPECSKREPARDMATREEWVTKKGIGK